MDENYDFDGFYEFPVVKEGEVYFTSKKDTPTKKVYFRIFRHKEDSSKGIFLLENDINKWNDIINNHSISSYSIDFSGPLLGNTLEIISPGDVILQDQKWLIKKKAVVKCTIKFKVEEYLHPLLKKIESLEYRINKTINKSPQDDSYNELIIKLSEVEDTQRIISDHIVNIQSALKTINDKFIILNDQKKSGFGPIELNKMGTKELKTKSDYSMPKFSEWLKQEVILFPKENT